MNRKQFLNQIEQTFQAVSDVDINRLERLVQDAHQCSVHEEKDPPEKFAITRQALRMLWMFRRNIDAVKIYREAK